MIGMIVFLSIKIPGLSCSALTLRSSLDPVRRNIIREESVADW